MKACSEFQNETQKKSSATNKMTRRIYHNKVLLSFIIFSLAMSAEQLSVVLSTTGICLGVLICSILLLANKTQVHANRLLVITVFSLTLAMVQAYLIYSGNLVSFPHFFRIPSPFFYLSLGTSYLYVRSVLNDETTFRKYDLLHFLPAVLHLVEMTPFYLKSAAEKRTIIEGLLQQPGGIAQLNEGLLPPYMHNLLRSVIGLIYVSLMIRLLMKASREQREEVMRTASFSWLIWFTAIMTMAVCSVLLILLLPQSPYLNKTLGIHLSVILCFVTLNFYLFFRPQILYGIPKLRIKPLQMNGEHNEIIDSASLEQGGLQLVEDGIDQADESSNYTSLDYLLAYKPVLELHLDAKKPYLQQGYNIGKLSSETGIPQHHLSALLNKVYGVRFNDFINQYRIKHITNNFNQSGWNQMTLEGIASEVGFNSRTTFFNAIKKSTGLSPSEYINKIRNEQQPSTDI